MLGLGLGGGALITARLPLPRGLGRAPGPGWWGRGHGDHHLWRRGWMGNDGPVTGRPRGHGDAKGLGTLGVPVLGWRL